MTGASRLSFLFIQGLSFLLLHSFWFFVVVEHFSPWYRFENAYSTVPYRCMFARSSPTTQLNSVYLCCFWSFNSNTFMTGCVQDHFPQASLENDGSRRRLCGLQRHAAPFYVPNDANTSKSFAGMSSQPRCQLSQT